MERSVEERWRELKQSIVESAEEHLQLKRKKQQTWITDDTVQLVERKLRAYN